MNSHFARQFFTVYVGVFYAPQVGRRGMFERFLADTPADGVPSTVVIVRTDRGGEFRGGEVVDLCRSRGIKEEFSTADSPKSNGLAERRLGLNDTAATEGRIQVS